MREAQMTALRWGAVGVGAVVGLWGAVAAYRAVVAHQTQLEQQARAADSTAKAKTMEAESALVRRDAALHRAEQADSVSRATSVANLRLARQLRLTRADLQRELDSLQALGHAPPPSLGKVLATCDSLAAAATDTLPCTRRVAARDTALAHADSAQLALKAANAALRREADLWHRAARPKFLGFLPPLRCVAGPTGGISFSGKGFVGVAVTCGLSLGH